MDGTCKELAIVQERKSSCFHRRNSQARVLASREREERERSSNGSTPGVFACVLWEGDAYATVADVTERECRFQTITSHDLNVRLR